MIGRACCVRKTKLEPVNDVALWIWKMKMFGVSSHCFISGIGFLCGFLCEIFCHSIVSEVNI